MSSSITVTAIPLFLRLPAQAGAASPSKHGALSCGAASCFTNCVWPILVDHRMQRRWLTKNHAWGLQKQLCMVRSSQKNRPPYSAALACNMNTSALLNNRLTHGMLAMPLCEDKPSIKTVCRPATQPYTLPPADVLAPAHVCSKPRGRMRPIGPIALSPTTAHCCISDVHCTCA